MFTIKRANLLFWTFLFLIILMQLSLSTSPDFSFFASFIHAVILVLTLRVHVHFLNLLIKKYLNTHDTAAFIFSALLISLVTSVILTVESYFVTILMLSADVLGENEMISLFCGMLLVSILISGMSYSIELFKQNIASEKRHQELRHSVLEMEIDHLRTQLSPHFTFNILNNLQFLIRKDQDEALELLSRYSKILRYYVYESQNKWIRLDDEISFLKHYFELEKDRSGEDLEISCRWDIPENTLLIIPFLLSTFVENAFKHVSAFTDKKNYIELHIFLREENQLVLTIKNSADTAALKLKKEGVGLRYVRKRLELSYPNNFTLELIPQSDSYSAALTLNLMHS